MKMASPMSVSDFCILCGEQTKGKKLPKFHKKIKNPEEKLMEVLGFSKDATEARVFGVAGLGSCKAERMFCECCEAWINRGIYLQKETITAKEKLIEAALLWTEREEIKKLLEDFQPDPCREPYCKVRKLITQWTKNQDSSSIDYGTKNSEVLPLGNKSPAKPNVSVRSQYVQTDPVFDSGSTTPMKSSMKPSTTTFTVYDDGDDVPSVSSSNVAMEISSPFAKRSRKSVHYSVLIPEIVFEGESNQTTSESESMTSFRNIPSTRVVAGKTSSKKTKMSTVASQDQAVSAPASTKMITRGTREIGGIPVLEAAAFEYTGPKFPSPRQVHSKRKSSNVSKTYEIITESPSTHSGSLTSSTNLQLEHSNQTVAAQDKASTTNAPDTKHLTASATVLRNKKLKEAVEIPVKGNESLSKGTIIDYRNLPASRDDRYQRIFGNPPKDTSTLVDHNCSTCAYQFMSSTTLALHNQESHANSQDAPIENLTFTCGVCQKEFQQAKWKWVERNKECYAALQHKGARQLFSTFTELCEFHLLKCLDNMEKAAEKKKRDEAASLALITPKPGILSRKPWSQNYYVCPICNLRFKPKYFATHFQEVHGLENVFNKHFFCSQCSKPYVSSRPGAGTGEFFGDEIEALKTFVETHSFCKLIQSDEPISQNCKFCTFQYTSTRNLILHEIEWHTENGEYQCEECSRRFAANSLLRRHFRSAHGQSSLIPCEVCAKPFTLAAMKRHMSSHTQTLYSCISCNQMFLNKKQLQNHTCGQEVTLEAQDCQIVVAQAVHVIRSEFQCFLCTIIYPTSEMLSLHFQEHHDGCTEGMAFECETCEFQTKQEDFEVVDSEASGSSTRKYFVTIDGSDTPVPSFCEVVENHIRRCKAHNRQPNYGAPELIEEERRFVCYKCDEIVQGPRFFTAHLHSHQGKPLYPCPLCYLNFQFVAAMRSHANRKHGLTFTQGTHCHCKHCKVPFMPDDPDITGGNFRRSDLEKLEEFQKEHAECRNKPTDSTILTCKYCEKNFTDPSKLFLHEVKVHTKKFPFQCDQCDKGYTKSYLLSHHVKSKHLGIKKQRRPVTPKVYICDQCGKVCKGYWILEEHQRRRHTQEKNIPCDSCDELFRTRAARNRHNAIVHKPVAKPCPICNLMCPNKYKLKTHIISHDRATVNNRDRLRRLKAKAAREAQGIFDGRLKRFKVDNDNPKPKSKPKPRTRRRQV